MVERVVSGGQTGADRAALDVALELGLEIGGWIPRGRRAEDGVVPDRYGGMIEADSDAYEIRTKLNVRDSDATAVFCFGAPAGGSALTVSFATSMARPLLLIDLDRCDTVDAVALMREWLDQNRPRVLNVAGPRASESRQVGAAVARVLYDALDQSRQGVSMS